MMEEHGKHSIRSSEIPRLRSGYLLSASVGLVRWLVRRDKISPYRGQVCLMHDDSKAPEPRFAIHAVAGQLHPPPPHLANPVVGSREISFHLITTASGPTSTHSGGICRHYPCFWNRLYLPSGRATEPRHQPNRWNLGRHTGADSQTFPAVTLLNPFDPFDRTPKTLHQLAPKKVHILSPRC